MKSVHIRCTCGSAIEFHDDAESLINSNGSSDKHGRKFLIELRADEWLDRHSGCINVKNMLLTEAAKKKSSENKPTSKPITK